MGKLLAGFVLGFAGCAIVVAGYVMMIPAPGSPVAEVRQAAIPSGALIGKLGIEPLYVFHDNESGNTCYGTPRGLSCVPMEPIK
ncbi:hypothetical protein PssvBMR6_gp07 [Pseudomonas phage MR6]|uniref:Lipoprotein n=1 Tax=Pseudomonas phage MR5 TaxID=2711172 RepID=A0A6M3TCN6_9CAUD|nr:hypothetical protein PssvBMR5_gp07 [Pseudomonas phage MR5]QJD54835.1 hypothetical protein PssvBMR6_gp07 [Pseudomonas phage MR6]QJD54894.1 hypothetical protein PssvBMR7_gp07 [Pseudomonas phage MR7]QJD54955.1 hypothetical protein PssvBMR8_gp07 [Pseudomonas phage MR8]QJD55012.1 hypothetical protein PssvBMR12_gp07 [Pseudomonas phage MR12]QJD55315.1 hypothetical protein PssvBMR18_gp07 [Pseudomonas phage MR18]QJF74576.1 hypothetical protein PssvBMR16_gp07 [Pseudomonas phage MR16]